MLFDDEDSIELDSFRKPPKCEALPLKAYISLKDLWVPSELLPSRNKVFDSNRNQSYIFHTLEKNNFESLSVYFEDSEEKLNTRGVSTNPLPYPDEDLPELYYSDDSDERVSISENDCSNNVMTKPSIADQKSESNNVNQVGFFLDIINNEGALCSDLFDNLTNAAVPELLNAEKECDESIQITNLPQTVTCQDEPVIELPFAYKRPALEESNKKQRNQKKKKTAAKKNLQLGDFLQTVNPDVHDDIPKRDEFYENLVRRGLCHPPELLNTKVDYPSFQSEEIRRIKSCSGDLFKPPVQKDTEQERLESDPVALSPVNKKPITTLILENISKEVPKENIESFFMSGYGELKKLSFEPCEKFMRIRVELFLDCDVDWVIGCLNGTEPFGASSGVVKCYKL